MLYLACQMLLGLALASMVTADGNLRQPSAFEAKPSPALQSPLLDGSTGNSSASSGSTTQTPKDVGQELKNGTEVAESLVGVRWCPFGLCIPGLQGPSPSPFWPAPSPSPSWPARSPGSFDGGHSSSSSHGSGGHGQCGCCCHGTTAKYSEFWETCAAPANACCGSCSVWRHEDHNRHGAQTAYGYMIVPSDPVSGMESITASTAGKYDYLWQAAAAKVQGHADRYALIANPYTARTQNQLHIHFKPLNGQGFSLRKQLEQATGCQTGGWHPVWDMDNRLGNCFTSRAQLFGSLPTVFSNVYSLAASGALGALLQNPSGQATLGTVGIAVLHICSGRPVVLATSSGQEVPCSIEHIIAPHPR